MTGGGGGGGGGGQYSLVNIVRGDVPHCDTGTGRGNRKLVQHRIWAVPHTGSVHAHVQCVLAHPC